MLRRGFVAAMWLSAAAGVFLAFAWPYAVSPDPSSTAFHAAAVGTLVVLLVSIAGSLVARR